MQSTSGISRSATLLPSKQRDADSEEMLVREPLVCVGVCRALQITVPNGAQSLSVCSYGVSSAVLIIGCKIDLLEGCWQQDGGTVLAVNFKTHTLSQSGPRDRVNCTGTSEVISKLHERMVNPKAICADEAFHHPHDILFKKFLSALVNTASKKPGPDNSVTDHSCPVDAQSSNGEKYPGNVEWQKRPWN